MPVILHQFTVAGAGDPGYDVARELARQCVDKYETNVSTGPGAGIAQGSCWAAVAVAPNNDYAQTRAVDPAAPAGAAVGVPGAGGTLPYSIVFGVSTMARINANIPNPGGVPGFAGGGHAERTALAQTAGCVLYPAAATGVLFVQLAPCEPCGTWLGGGGGGVPNPFGPVIGGGGTTLHVWYRWPYPGGVNDMVVWNGTPRAAKLDGINTW